MFVEPYNERAVAGTAATLSWQQVTGDGAPGDPGTGVTVTVTRSDGTVLVAAGATSGATSEPRTKALTVAQTATLDRLSAAWTSSGGVVLATTEIDVVSAPWFSNAELRAAQPSIDATGYPAAAVTIARLQVEAFLERLTHRRFVPGYDYVTLRGNPSQKLILPGVDIRTIRSAALYDDPSSTPIETLGAGELAAIPRSSNGVIERYNGTWDARWVKIGFEWGYTAPPPDGKREAMLLCRHLLHAPQSQIPDNATSWQSVEMGWNAILITPGLRGAHTRYPTVNKFIDDFEFKRIGMA